MSRDITYAGSYNDAFITLTFIFDIDISNALSGYKLEFDPSRVVLRELTIDIGQWKVDRITSLAHIDI